MNLYEVKKKIIKLIFIYIYFTGYHILFWFDLLIVKANLAFLHFWYYGDRISLIIRLFISEEMQIK